MLNFLKHPIYAAMALGLCGWLTMANARGWNLWQSAGPPMWFSAVRSGFSHK